MNRIRGGVVLLLLVGWIGGIGYRLFDLQVRRSEDYRRQAERQQQRVVELDPPRGTIYDRRGRPLAVSVTVESAYAVPARVKDPQHAAAKIAAIIGEEPREILKSLTAERSFVWVARKLDPDQSGQIRALGLDGVDFVKESRRYYPNGTLAANLLGFVGTDHHGLGGLEARYNETVTGATVERQIVRDARGAWVTAEERAFFEPEPGADLTLTIDAVVQSIVESELTEAVKKSNALGGMAAFLDPSNGDILAMAAVPTFNPNEYGKATAHARRLRPVSDVFEPGSTFKVFPLAAALADHLLTVNDEFDCGNGFVILGNGKRVKDHHAYDRLTVTEILAKSSNVGAIRIGEIAGRDRLYATISDFGFGRRTRVDLPGESGGILRKVEDWDKYQHAYVSFGHGVSVTAVQLVNAFAAIANGGTLWRPRVVAKVGETPSSEPEVLGRPIDRATAISLERVLEAVAEEGTAKSARVPGYRVAGKTGTPQKLMRDGRGYSHQFYMPSFVGFAPAREPQIVGLVLIDEPAGAEEGGVVAAPTFRRIAERIFRYWRLAPDDSWPPEPEVPAPMVAALSEAGLSASNAVAPSPVAPNRGVEG